MLFSIVLFQWFINNQIKVNSEKCYFKWTNDTVNLIIEYQIIDNSKREKLLGVKFDYKLRLMHTLMISAKKQA